MTDITENDLDEEDAGPKPRVTDTPIEIWLQGAARVVREALLDARRYKWLRDTPGVSWDELTDGGVSMWVGDASAIRAPSLDAAIDAAMAKDGA